MKERTRPSRDHIKSNIVSDSVQGKFQRAKFLEVVVEPHLWLSLHRFESAQGMKSSQEATSVHGLGWALDHQPVAWGGHWIVSSWPGVDTGLSARGLGWTLDYQSMAWDGHWTVVSALVAWHSFGNYTFSSVF